MFPTGAPPASGLATKSSVSTQLSYSSMPNITAAGFPLRVMITRSMSVRIRLTSSGKLCLASDKRIVPAIVDLRVQNADAIAQGGSRVKPPRAS